MKTRFNIPWSSDFPTSCFPRAVELLMEYFKERPPRWSSYCISGSAFSTFWNKEAGDNTDITIIGEQPYDNIFSAYGFKYQYLPINEQQSVLIKRIKECIDKRWPVLGRGIVGPPEYCLISGYECEGEKLIGRSFYYNGTRDYFEVDDWYDSDRTWGIIVLTEKTEKLSEAQIIKNMLAWAIKLYEESEFRHVVSGKLYKCGFAAYDDIINEFRNDSNFPENNPELLRTRCMTFGNDTVHNIAAKRKEASDFFLTYLSSDESSKIIEKRKEYSDYSFFVTDNSLKKDAEALGQALKKVSKCWQKVSNHMPFSYSTQNDQLALCDNKLREKFVKHIEEAKENEVLVYENLKLLYSRL